MRGADFTRSRARVSLVAPTDTGRDIARAAQSLFAREDMPIGGVRLFGVRVEGLQSRSGGVAVTTGPGRAPRSLRACDGSDRSKFGAGALAPATLLGKKVPGRRSFGAEDGHSSGRSDSPEASAGSAGDARGEQGMLL